MKIWIGALAFFATACLAQAERQPAISLQELLQQVERGTVADKRENAERLEFFRQARAGRQQQLTQVKRDVQAQETRSEQLEQTFENNEQDLANLQQRLDERLGSLKELFGVLQQVASDAQAQFSNSVTEIQYPDRSEYLLAFAQKMGQTADLPSIKEIERVWFELQREMTASGQVVKATMPVVKKNGEETTAEVIRVGNFNLIADGKYYQFVPETSRVVEYGRQPRARYMEGAQNIADAGEPVFFTIDPLRGQLLSLLVLAPKLTERVAQGGAIGYVIISLGVFGILLALFKLVALSFVNHRMNRQKQDLQRPADNPLGRVIKAYQNLPSRDPELVELKLGEAILREVPRVNRGIALLKIIAAVAPLMGLLGTVTGMIITFQAITLFGAGDPKLMAGGISQALVTTVLGLCVAIPVLLLHTLVQSRAQQISEVLEQESVALIATDCEPSKD
ncbi:DUF3450 family protein [Exilibacterium tricleocarpae]|uniref:DUF3450 family protein n=2 Tax=Exilibacterium tricleocarpae TaxID=2591008 RepID=A0A545SZ30_9GAMM|nr:DUF3450 family protein [Exilibacterium tricleocarpae]